LLASKHISFLIEQISCLFGAKVTSYVRLQRQTRCR